MQIPNQQSRPFTGANMTPMIDVVFLLIIFFLVSSHLAQQESRLPVDLPTAASHLPLDVTPVSLTVTVDRDHQVLVGGRVTATADLDSLFAAVVAEEGDSASLRIRSDGDVPYELIEPVLRASAKAGLLDIKLAVKQ
ncbi:biopolymer transporter ExbD [Stieleria sp. TO1_6]|uniref:ExbD/TolR family protein n=1 Tax=Stieleria tagensis TaxID=2956795 RepID=UPI00209B48F7|nr:biopolymer transporter ExbD [Stieleria tagensis]MCO8121208.1 biopolymer transporter ExbD [Stieleria tagensis]